MKVKGWQLVSTAPTLRLPPLRILVPSRQRLDEYLATSFACVIDKHYRYGTVYLLHRWAFNISILIRPGASKCRGNDAFCVIGNVAGEPDRYCHEVRFEDRTATEHLLPRHRGCGTVCHLICGNPDWHMDNLGAH